jgi:hypothetical protein
MKLCVATRPKFFENSTNIFKQLFLCILLMFRVKLVSYNIHIDVLLDNLIIGIFRSNYMNLEEIMCSYTAKTLKNSNNIFK